MLLAAARYMQSQLSRAAERDRILSSLHDAVVRHRAVFESAMDGIVTLDESGCIESFNPAAERLFATQADAVLGRPFRLIEDPARGDALERLRGVANSGGACWSWLDAVATAPHFRSTWPSARSSSTAGGRSRRSCATYRSASASRR